jgi:hypothetical protein
LGKNIKFIGVNIVLKFLNLDAQKLNKIELILCVLSIIFVILFFIQSLIRPITDGDIWFNILYGKLMLQNKTLIIDHSIFSWTPSDNSLIYCGWIPQIFYYLVYELLGVNGIILIRFLVSSIFLFSIIYFAYKNNILNNPLVWLITFLSLTISQYGMVDKAQLFSFLFFFLSLFIFWFLITKKNFSPYLFYLFPLMMIIWVNSHGGFIFGLILYFTFVTGEFITEFVYPQNALEKKYRVHFYFAMFLSFLACFITPYGIDYLIQVLNITILQKGDRFQIVKDIMEFQPSFDSMSAIQTYIVNFAFFIILFLLIINIMKKNMNIALFTSLLLFSFIFHKYIRVISFWGLVFNFSGLYILSINNFYDKFKNIYFRLLINLIVLSFIAFMSVYIFQERYCKSELIIDKGFAAPKEEVEYIKQNFSSSKIGNTYIIGTYILWELYPNNKVMMDPRQFPYYSIWNEYHNFFQQAQNPQYFLNKYPPDLLIIEKYRLRFNLIFWLAQSPDWKLIFWGKDALIFLRKDIPVTLTNYKIYDYLNDSNLDNKFIENFNLFFNLNLLEDAKNILDLIEKQKSIFCPARAKLIDVMQKHLVAKKAYLSGDYASAVKIYDEVGHSLFQDTTIHSFSHLKIAEKSWQNNELVNTFQRLLRAYKLKDPDLAYYYNLGISGYMIEKNNLLDKLNDDEKKLIAEWRSFLLYYIRNNSIFSDTLYLQYAKDSIEGTLNNRPDLIFPKDNLICTIP